VGNTLFDKIVDERLTDKNNYAEQADDNEKDGVAIENDGKSLY
jgi:hypothetical protein